MSSDQIQSETHQRLLVWVGNGLYGNPVHPQNLVVGRLVSFDKDGFSVVLGVSDLLVCFLYVG
jgi:hypothetical protein